MEPTMFNHKVSYSLAHSAEHLLVKKFVQQNYQKSFHINIEEIFPHFLTINKNYSNCYKAVVGINDAENESLFSEYYLDNSVEQELLTLTGKKISRDYIVEVGNLATLGGKEFRQLIVALTAYLYTAGYQYVIFTTFPVVSNSFRKMGLKLYQLAHANLEQLPQAHQKQWSHDYYKLQPKVFAGVISQGFNTISSTIHKTSPELQNIWQQSICLAKQSKPLSIAS